jgi:hypothetical protein
MKHALFQKRNTYLLCVLMLMLNLCCRQFPTQPAEKPYFAVESVACTEAWINLNTSTIQGTATLTLTSDAKPVRSFMVNNRDTVLHLDSLLPGKTYSLGGSLRTTNSTATMQQDFRTMDTTSHDWKFDLSYLGEASHSQLCDIALINDSLGYAVGDIYQENANGGLDLFPYCLEQWNGKTWTAKKLYSKFVDYSGTESINAISNLSCIIAFSPTDIWFAGGNIYHWNGKDTITEMPFSWTSDPNKYTSIVKIWGSSSHDLYGVGYDGAIVHQKNGIWKRLESGTNLNFSDIWGSADGSEILAGAYNLSVENGKMLVCINGDKVSPVFDKGLSEVLSLWFIPGQIYYMAGDGLAFKHQLDNTPWFLHVNGDITTYISLSVRGNDVNDVFVVSGGYELLHYNGVTWHNYRDQIPLNPDGWFSAVSIKGNLMLISGCSSTQAVVVVGRR